MRVEWPQQIHPYSYANGNPVTLSDPTGLSPLTYNTIDNTGWVIKVNPSRPSRPAGSSGSSHQSSVGTSVSGHSWAPQATSVTTQSGSRALQLNAGPQKKESSGWGLMDWIHTGLDVLGFVPVVGEIADGANAVLYAIKGDWRNAAISAAAIIPLIGGAATGIRLTNNAYRAGNHMADAVASFTKKPAVGDDLLKPGPWASESVSSSSPKKITQSERDALNPIGEEYGCHSCGATSSGTSSGNWIGDHQPPTRISGGSAQELYPHCQSCSNSQGLWIINLIRKGEL